MKNNLFRILVSFLIFVSCNKKREFPNYEYQTVYFAYQNPVRTITLGEDVFDTELDNQHKFRIMATTGGVYTSPGDVTIDVAIDNAMTNRLFFTPGGDPVVALPANYYSLASNKIVIPKGSITGGVEIQLSEAFFADPLAIKNTYVVPMVMKNVTNADSILSGKNFVLYAVKYVNPWHGNYLRRGKDEITGSVTKTTIRHQQYVEKDEVKMVSTRSMSTVAMPLTFQNAAGANVNCTLLLNFDNSGNCTVSSATTGVTASGNGKFVKRGEKKSWGDMDRDAMYLNYQLSISGMNVASTDTLVLRDRAVKMEVFTPVTQ